jgi:ASC-1-like (ASCH) protein
MRRMFFKHKYLRYILDGVKSLEGRVGYDNIRDLRIGVDIYLNGEHRARIVDIKNYASFQDAITEDNYRLLIPDAHSPEETIRTYEQLFPLWKQKKLGVYILKLKYPVEKEEEKTAGNL